MRVFVRLPDQELVRRELGGKADGLSRLLLAGARVPPAFVLRADRTPDRDELKRELAQVWEELGGGPVAVRSSAVAEDSGAASFAGQHDTVLEVKSLAEAEAAIERCQASAYSARAIEYRSRAGVHDASMAVIVQKMVRADAAGVLFTCDPVARRRDRLLVEAVRGLGDALVSGRATPSRWIVGRDDPAVLEYTPASPDEPAPLSEALVLALAREALRLESALGGPQDIEWAVEGGELFFLQARPVTTALDKPTRTLAWTNSNTGELVPDAVTPLAFTLLERSVRSLLEGILAKLGVDVGDAPIVGVVGGRIYFCLNTLVSMVRRMPGASGKHPADLFGGDRAGIDRAMAALKPSDYLDVNVKLTAMVAGGARLMFTMLRHSRVDEAAALAPVAAIVGELAKQPPASLGDRELADRLEERPNLLVRSQEGLLAGLVGLACAQALPWLTRRWLGDADGSLGNRLLTGLGGLDSAEASLALWKLSEHARPLAAELSSGRRWAELARDPAAGAFSAELERFMRDHGHHARSELDLFVPRWSEEPDAILATLRAFLARPEAKSPIELHRERGEARKALEAECRARLSWPLTTLFDAVLGRAQRAFRIRENLKSMGVRLMGLTRMDVLEAARRLVARTVIAEVEDIFFFELQEVSAALRDPQAAPSAETLAERRRIFREAQALAPPPVVVGAWSPDQGGPAPVEGGELMRGIGVSAGVAEGIARVVLRADEETRVSPGEILVAPFTDPGWTPYFVAAAAVVVDLGGVLSHGSIVAREYGIPAVVNVGRATKVVKSGQRLRVDGNRGEVTILDV
jgi:pyruvate,water dikinase